MSHEIPNCINSQDAQNDPPKNPQLPIERPATSSFSHRIDRGDYFVPQQPIPAQDVTNNNNQNSKGQV